MRAFAERGYDLIIGVGFAQAPIMDVVAKDYPNLNFAILESGFGWLPFWSRRLDDQMIYVGGEHRAEGLTRRGFQARVDDPAAVQPVFAYPKPGQAD